MLWSEDVDSVLAGDITAALAYLTRAGGAVVTAVAPVGMRDGEQGTVTFTSSLGFGKKLERIQRGSARGARLPRSRARLRVSQSRDCAGLAARGGPRHRRVPGGPPHFRRRPARRRTSSWPKIPPRRLA